MVKALGDDQLVVERYRNDTLRVITIIDRHLIEVIDGKSSI
jgi:hypothetical protein